MMKSLRLGANEALVVKKLKHTMTAVEAVSKLICDRASGRNEFMPPSATELAAATKILAEVEQMATEIEKVNWNDERALDEIFKGER